jgi:hypothetical protein
VKTKGKSSKTYPHTTKDKQNGVETKEGATICAHSSGLGCSFIKQEMKGEESSALDYKR